MALAAFARLREQVPTARMVVAGEGPLRRGLSNQHPAVLFTGALSVEDLARHYASADVFLFPSMSETFGNVLLEAMASGLATVSFCYAAPKAFIQHDDNGLLAPFGDETAWLDQACALVADPVRIARLRPAARATALTIGWEAVIDRFEHLLRRVADPQDARSALPMSGQIASNSHSGISTSTA